MLEGVIDEVYSTIKEAKLELIRSIPIETLLDMAKETEVEDSPLRTRPNSPQLSPKNLLTDDSQLLKRDAQTYAENQRSEILPLK